MLPRDEILRRLKLVRHSSYADRIRKRSLTITELAQSVGCSREYLHQIISGKASIGPQTRAALSDYFECEQNDGERSSACPTPTAAFSTGSGGVFTVKWPDFGPERPRRRGMR
jgi:hypothetical protein